MVGLPVSLLQTMLSYSSVEVTCSNASFLKNLALRDNWVKWEANMLDWMENMLFRIIFWLPVAELFIPCNSFSHSNRSIRDRVSTQCFSILTEPSNLLLLLHVPVNTFWRKGSWLSRVPLGIKVNCHHLYHKKYTKDLTGKVFFEKNTSTLNMSQIASSLIVKHTNEGEKNLPRGQITF